MTTKRLRGSAASSALLMYLLGILSFESLGHGDGVLSNLKSVQFYPENFPVLADPGSPPYNFSSPHWTAENGVLRPTAYVSLINNPGAYLGFDVSGFESTCRVYVKASGGGFSFEPTFVDVTPQNNGQRLHWGVTSLSKFTPQKAEKQQFTISAEVWVCDDVPASCDIEDAVWTSKGQSSPIDVYVLFANPLKVDTPQAPLHYFYIYHSVCELACNPGGTSENSIISNTFSSFSNRSVKNHSGQTLKYYPSGNSFSACPYAKIWDLLQFKKGQCHAFTELLMYSLAVNGIRTEWGFVEPIGRFGNGPYPDDQHFVFDNLYPGYSGSTWVYPWWMEGFSGPNNDPGGAFIDMVPWSFWYGDIINYSGAPGQNSSDPSQKVFGNHSGAAFPDGTIYDASLGKIYTDVPDLESTSLFGFGGHARTGTGWSDEYIRQEDTSVVETVFAPVPYFQ